MKNKKGFAAMSPEQHRKIASMGGKASQATGKTKRFTKGSKFAKDAGRKGGKAVTKLKVK